jgi:hypothetical protein
VLSTTACFIFVLVTVAEIFGQTPIKLQHLPKFEQNVVCKNTKEVNQWRTLSQLHVCLGRLSVHTKLSTAWYATVGGHYRMSDIVVTKRAEPTRRCVRVSSAYYCRKPTEKLRFDGFKATDWQSYNSVFVR